MAAGILGVTFDDLWKRERRRARKIKSIWGLGIASCILGVGIGLSWVDTAAWQRQYAEKMAAEVAKQQTSADHQAVFHLTGARYAVAALPPPRALFPRHNFVEEILDQIDASALHSVTKDIDTVAIQALAFRSEQPQLAVSAYDGRIEVFDLTNFEPVATLVDSACVDDERTFGADCSVKDLWFTGDGAFLITLAHGGSVAVYSTGSWTVEYRREVADCPRPDEIHHLNCAAAGLFISSDQTTFGAATRDGRVELFDLASGESISIDRLGRNIRSIQLNSQPDELLISTDNEVQIWTLPPDNLLEVISLGSDTGPFSVVPVEDRFWYGEHFGFGLQSVPEGNLFGDSAFVSSECGELPDIDELDLLAEDPCEIQAFARSNDLSTFATGVASGWIEVWDAQTGESRDILRGHEQAIDAIAFSPDGNWLASGAENGALRAWRMEKTTEGIFPASASRELICKAFPMGALKFPEHDLQSDWRLRIRNPDPCQWHGFASLGFWTSIPAMIQRLVERI